MGGMPILSALILVPLAGAVLTAALSGRDERLAKGVGLTVALVNFALSLPLLFNFAPLRAGFQVREYRSIVRDWGMAWDLGVDGISLFLVLLTTFLMPIALLGAWRAIEHNAKLFVAAMLVLESAVLGTFLSLNLFFFFVFWELVLLPMVLIIGIWGSGERIKSAIKFFLFTALGSLLMLVAILVMVREAALQFGAPSFAYYDLLRLQLDSQQALWLFAAFTLAFAIKVPVLGLHTWLPDAHTDAPTPGSVVLAGVLLKMGTYGLIRFAIPLFPEAALTAAPVMVALAAAGIVFGALVAWVQTDVKKLIAYSSVSHMGFIVLGLFAMNHKAGTGAVLQMINHGITTGALFLLIGIIYERRHTRRLDEFGGLATVMPRYALIFVIATMSSVGLPGLNGFVGEFLILFGAFDSAWFLQRQGLGWTGMIPVAVAATGVVLSALYMLTLVLKMFFGPVVKEANRSLKDLNWREWAVLLPLVALMFAIGLKPQDWIKRIEPSVREVYQQRATPFKPTRPTNSDPIYDPYAQDTQP